MSFKPHYRVYLTFFLLSLATGALMARMPDLQLHLEVDKAELGLTLIGMAIGALVSLTTVSPLIMRLGARASLLMALLGIAALLSLVPLATNPAVVFALFFGVGALGGALEITLNVEIGRIEPIIGYGIMNRAHGFWSVGFFVTAISASIIRQAGVSMQTHLHAVMAVVFIVGLAGLIGMKNAKSVETAHAEKAPHFALPTWGLAPLCIIGISAFLVEGAGIDWSAIYMRDAFNAEPFIGGTGLTLFAFFMAVARLLVDPVVDRYGARRVAVVLLSTAAAGIGTVWLAPHPYLALAGFALMGFGCSAVYPMAITAAAQRTDRPAVVNVAALGQMAFVVFFLAPPLLGFVAEHWGIRTAYLVCLPLILISIFAGRALASKAPAPIGLAG